MTRRPAYSVIIPCHNEADHVATMLRKTQLAFRGVDYEILLVLDGCTDDTEAIALGEAASIPEARILTNRRRLGKGGAIRKGVREARGAYVGFIDGDGEIDPAYLRTAFRALETGTRGEMVVGNRYARGGSYHTTFLRHLTSRAYQAVIWVLFGLGLHDTQAGLKTFTADAAKRLFSSSHVDGYAFDIDVLTHAHWSGYRIEEIPIRQRFKGTSTMKPRYVLEMIADTCRIFDRHVRELLSRRGMHRSATAPQVAWALCLFPFTWLFESALGWIIGSSK